MKVLGIIYMGLIGVMLFTLIWVAFDIHHRIGFLFFAQAPVLIMRAILKTRAK